MKILILNWRDIKNPSSGGAEILTHEIAKRLVSWGNEVIQFSGGFNGALSEEVIDGVKIIRRGNSDIGRFSISVHIQAFIFYRKQKGKFDLVIDEVHGIPFFTPWYVREKKVVFICEVAGELWKKFFGFWTGSFGWLIEKTYLSFFYKNIPFITISESTKKDLSANGVNEKNILVLPMGISVPNKKVEFKKENKKTLIFVGRLTVAKGIEDTLIAFHKLIQKDKEMQLWIVGRGMKSYTQQLQKICQKLKMEKNVTFFGYVDEIKKFNLLGRAHILIHPSFQEGFGLTIPEAGFVGTPVIAYNSSGLRDIVKDGINGLLLKENSVDALVEQVLQLLSNDTLYKKLCKGAKEEAKQYNWDNTARILLGFIKNL